ncbi:Hsp20/alpha crystallin family protein [Fictibacillus nanhaiensis]|uniref:Hsp20/alpha crystallin family protein n=1 Tax=Fictibacillus nanhaiensis TaxID=742169 RepID=UPI001C95F423|nr:Hsp20/alpha crystallin family protein [Fictibacillus nanhaiensis]MBY6038111.1 Hsp20/alpha crystallin family protein [Fictibacillus nanhaiensis]
MDTWKQMMDWKRMADQYFGDQFFTPSQGQRQEPEVRQENETPLCNIYETAQEICCVLALPGLNRTEDVDVFVDSVKLTVQGKLSIVLESYKVNQEEFQLGEFKREITLPVKVHPEPVQAFYRKGLLFIRMLKDHRAGENRRKVNLNWVQE